MTVNTLTSKITYLANGSTTQWNFPFPGVAATDLQVIVRDTAGLPSTISPALYSVALNAPVGDNPTGIGGTITYPLSGSPLAVGYQLTIIRVLPVVQGTSLNDQGTLWPPVIEQALDYMTMILQQFNEQLLRQLTAPVSDPDGLIYTLPTAAERANTGLLFDSQGNVIAGTTPATGIISTAMQPVVDAATRELGTGLLKYLPPGAPASVFLVDSIDRGYLHVKDFGATGDGVTDDTVAVQLWLNAIANSGLPGWLDHGFYLCGPLTCVSNTPIYIDGPGGIDQWHNTATGASIVARSDAMDLLTITATAPILFSGFDLSGVHGATSGTLLKITSNDNYNTGSSFRRMSFNYGYDGFNMITGGEYQLEECFFQSQAHAAVSLGNTNNVDAGDMGIVDCIFFGPGTTSSIAIFQHNAGGLRLIGNKISNYGYGYRQVLDNGVNTSDLFINGNSFESAVAGSFGVYFANPVSATFQTIAITGNEINHPFAIHTANCLGALTDMTITGNVLLPDVSPATGINIGATTQGVVISANLINGAAIFATAVGIQVSSSSSNISIVGNSILNCHTGITGSANGFNIADNIINCALGGTPTGIVLGNCQNGVVIGNVLLNLTTKLTFGTSDSVAIVNNYGYNPVGISTPAPPASGATYTAGPTPEDIYIRGGTVTAISLAGTTIFTSTTIADVVSFRLAPHGTFAMNYSVAPTMIRSIQ